MRIQCSGRLGGSEMGRREWYREGRVPLHTLRADIDYGLAEAKTTYGVIGVKCWIFKGDDRGQGHAQGIARAARRRGAAEVARCSSPRRSSGASSRRAGCAARRIAAAISTSATTACRRVDRARVTSRQIEAARVAMTRHVKRGGKVWIRVFPDKPVTKKPAETRMGKGKGNPEEWVAVVKPGRILYEMEGVPLKVAQEAMRLAAHKLPMKTRLVQSRGPRMKAREIRELTLEELTVKSRELRGDLFNAHREALDRSAREHGEARTASPRHRSRGDGSTREARSMK